MADQEKFCSMCLEWKHETKFPVASRHADGSVKLRQKWCSVCRGTKNILCVLCETKKPRCSFNKEKIFEPLLMQGICGTCVRKYQIYSPAAQRDSLRMLVEAGLEKKQEEVRELQERVEVLKLPA